MCIAVLGLLFGARDCAAGFRIFQLLICKQGKMKGNAIVALGALITVTLQTWSLQCWKSVLVLRVSQVNFLFLLTNFNKRRRFNRS
jgi:hypothetical protein